MPEPPGPDEPSHQDPEFTGETPEEPLPALAVPEPEPTPAEPLEAVPVADKPVEEADAVAIAIDELTRQLGSRVERILVADGGVLAVLDRLDDEAQAVAEALSSEEVAVAVLDARTYTALRRLGSSSPVALAREAWQRPEPLLLRRFSPRHGARCRRATC